MKMTRFNFVFGIPQHVARDNEGDAAATAAAEAAATKAAVDAAAAAATKNVADVNEGTGDDADKTYNQKDVNKIVVQRNKALKAQYEAVEQTQKGLLEEKNLTVQQRTKNEAD